MTNAFSRASLLASLPGLLLASGLGRAQAAPASSGGSLLAFDFNAAPWPRAVASASGGATARVTRDDSGTIDAYKGKPSGAMSLTADFSKANAKARAGLWSGPLEVRNSEPNLAKLTIGFDVWAGQLRPIRVVVQSLNAAGKVTGSRAASVLPPVASTWYRCEIDLDKTQEISGDFNPRAARMQLAWEIEGARGAGEVLRVDNVSFSAPTFYVSAGGSDAADGKSEASAFATIQKAIDAAGAGDVICVMDGIYTSTNVEQIALYTKNGSPARWITLRANPGHHPELHTTGWNGIRINAAGSYFEIRDMIVRGKRRELKLEDAMADEALKTKNGKNHPGDPRFNSNGISIQSTTKSETERPHHIRILNNTVVDNPGGGISAIGCDYVTIERNTVRDNCHFMRYAGSGISIFRSWNFDDFKGHKMFVLNNICSGNRTFVPWSHIGKISDGNGIIVDDNINSQSGASKIPYEGRTLVQNNLSFGNGGSGIHAYASRFVDIVHNTAYHNALSPELVWSQIFAGGKCDDVRILNNVFVAPAGKPLDLSTPKSSSNIVYANNLFWGEGNNNVKSGGGLGAESGAGQASLGSNVQADPKFLKPSLDPEAADFRLAPDSPGVDKGAPHVGVPLVDLLGHKRPQGAAPDLGAYELAAQG
jgi:parallel beta-helix repeat protein